MHSDFGAEITRSALSYLSTRVIVNIRNDTNAQHALSDKQARYLTHPILVRLVEIVCIDDTPMHLMTAT